MSKVEVKKGDRFFLSESAIVWQVRGSQCREILRPIGIHISRWLSFDYSTATEIRDKAAIAWIESLGGTVVEEREEEKPAMAGSLAVAHVSEHDGGLITWSLEGSSCCKSRDAQTGWFRRIHIAGVTT